MSQFVIMASAFFNLLRTKKPIKLKVILSLTIRPLLTVENLQIYYQKARLDELYQNLPSLSIFDQLQKIRILVKLTTTNKNALISLVRVMKIDSIKKITH